MISPVLIVCAAIAFLLMLVGNIYFLVYFQHEDDKNQAWFPKIVVFISLTLVETTVLLLPFDVAISGSGVKYLDNMEILWMFVYMVLAVFLILIVPFTLFYYESWDPEGKSSQLLEAIKLQICTLVTVLLVLLIMFFTIGVADVPYRAWNSDFERPNTTHHQYNLTRVETYNVTHYNGVNQTDTFDTVVNVTYYEVQNVTLNYTAIPLKCNSSLYLCDGKSKHLEIPVTFPVYLIALISFAGWFLFVPFAGVGLAALPLDLLAAFRFRPRKLPLDVVVKKKMDLNRRAAALKELGARIEKEGRHKKRTRKNLKVMNNLRKSVYFLERDYEYLIEATKGSNPFVYLGYLLLSIATLAFSLCWIIHIGIFMLREIKFQNPFLNNLFVELDNSFSFLGTVFYAAFSFHLVWATIKGCIKLGMRIVFFSIHPMKVGATLMNAFLFNTALILLCSVPIVQFCTTAFALYVNNTAISMIFAIQVTNLKFFKYFYVNKVFLYALLIFFALSFVLLLLFPSDREGIRKKQKRKQEEEDGWIV